METDKALQLALGNLDVNTMRRIDNFNPGKDTVSW